MSRWRLEDSEEMVQRRNQSKSKVVYLLCLLHKHFGTSAD